ncbi:digestive cysteine proteinase 2-like [Planoprotostelium fungivorum]|uniref:Digestive cysteine proteinase 2-like n=1 Tax=Planoprotostelium fungivorum TaxID=1890364 RepID=A0A2P6N1X5_9EUKA|nr:digestive cysteine proteinase 2-like [Planoprotostelium fungivorum]
MDSPVDPWFTAADVRDFTTTVNMAHHAKWWLSYSRESHFLPDAMVAGRFLFGLLILALIAAVHSISLEEKSVLISINRIRESVYPAAHPPLQPLSWDESLAEKARSWVSQCIVGSDPSNRFLRTETTWASHGADLSFLSVVAGWSHESRVFGWDLEYIRDAKNYTAIVWQNTTSVGCAKHDCGGSIGTLFHCVFDPRGNYPGLLPYSVACHPDPSITCLSHCGEVFDGCSTLQCIPCHAITSNSIEKRDGGGSCWKSIGCSNSDPNQPIMTNNVWTDNKKMTVESCVQYCVNSGYPYAGLTNGDTCICDFNYGDNQGGSCDTACAGNTGQSCGGKPQVFVYDVTSCSSQSQCQYQGCIKKSDLSWRSGISIGDVKGCVNKCSKDGYPYMGISNGWCYCAVSYNNKTLLSDGTCNSPCGDGQSCGNSDQTYVSVYPTIGCSEPGYQYKPTFDWRRRGNVVGAVRDQSSCGTCWSFASTSSLESVWAINYNVSAPVLSEQQITSCSSSDGCGGGNNGMAWGWVQKNGGQAKSNQVSPYVAKDLSSGATCQTAKSEITIAPNAPNSIVRAKGSEDAIMKALEYGPMYMGCVLSSTFGQFSGGVYIDDEWKTKSNSGHAMTIVGYVNGAPAENIPIAPKDLRLHNKTVQLQHQQTGLCLTLNLRFDGGEATLKPCADASTSAADSQKFTILSNGVDKQWTIQVASKKGFYLDSWYADVDESVHGATSGKGDLSRITFIINNFQNRNIYEIVGIGNSYSFASNVRGLNVTFSDMVVTGPQDNARWVFLGKDLPAVVTGTTAAPPIGTDTSVLTNAHSSAIGLGPITNIIACAAAVVALFV